jgi:fructan beta-fructosidase
MKPVIFPEKPMETFAVTKENFEFTIENLTIKPIKTLLN